MARSLGVTQLVVAFNKLEKLDWSAERYDGIKAIIQPYLSSIGFKKQDVTYIPISGLAGENLCERSKDSRLLSWYGEDSPCLLEVLDRLNLPPRNYSKPIRASISEYCPKQQGVLIGDCVAVKVEAGVIKEREELLLMP